MTTLKKKKKRGRGASWKYGRLQTVWVLREWFPTCNSLYHVRWPSLWRSRWGMTRKSPSYFNFLVKKQAHGHLRNRRFSYRTKCKEESATVWVAVGQGPTMPAPVTVSLCHFTSLHARALLFSLLWSKLKVSGRADFSKHWKCPGPAGELHHFMDMSDRWILQVFLSHYFDLSSVLQCGYKTGLASLDFHYHDFALYSTKFLFTANNFQLSLVSSAILITVTFLLVFLFLLLLGLSVPSCPSPFLPFRFK